jgi:hypothetical protein
MTRIIINGSMADGKARSLAPQHQGIEVAGLIDMGDD